MREHLLKKHIDWKYEDEWRIIAESGIGTYSDTSIHGIILGLKMPSDDRTIIRAIFKGKKINFFEVVKIKNDFAVHIKPIDD